MATIRLSIDSHFSIVAMYIYIVVVDMLSKHHFSILAMYIYIVVVDIPSKQGNWLHPHGNNKQSTGIKLGTFQVPVRCYYPWPLD